MRDLRICKSINGNAVTVSVENSQGYKITFGNAELTASEQMKFISDIQNDNITMDIADNMIYTETDSYKVLDIDSSDAIKKEAERYINNLKIINKQDILKGLILGRNGHYSKDLDIKYIVEHKDEYKILCKNLGIKNVNTEEDALNMIISRWCFNMNYDYKDLGDSIEINEAV